jgi:Transglycosylase SLT domain
LPNAAVVDAITRAAREDGVDPSFALATAERESSFNPNAKASKTIRGLFQMKGDLRQKYGVGDSTDPYLQAKGWTAFINDTKADMASRLGRDPTPAETYMGHFWGPGRAARMIAGDPSTPVEHIFTQQELEGNPGLTGTAGRVMGNVTADMGQRIAKFGGAAGSSPTDFAEFGQAAGGAKPGQPDFSEFGQAAKPIDFAEYGQATGGEQPTSTDQPAQGITDMVSQAKTAISPSGVPTTSGLRGLAANPIRSPTKNPASGNDESVLWRGMSNSAVPLPYDTFPQSENVDDRRDDVTKAIDSDYEQHLTDPSTRVGTAFGSLGASNTYRTDDAPHPMIRTPMDFVPPAGAQ